MYYWHVSNVLIRTLSPQQAYRPSVERRRGADLIVGVDTPGVLPAPTVGGIVLTTGLAARGDGLPRHQVDDRVGMEGGPDGGLEKSQRSAAGYGRLALKPAHNDRQEDDACKRRI